MSRASSRVGPKAGAQRAGTRLATSRGAAVSEAIGPARDTFEHEAERIAVAVTRGAAAPVGAGAWSAAASDAVPLRREAPRIRREPKEAKNDPAPEARAADASSVAPARGPEQETRLLAEDDAEATQGRMHKGEFLALLRGEVCAAVDGVLKESGRDSQGCPWIDHWFGYYASRGAAQVERALHRYAPETRGASSVQQYVAAVVERVRTSARGFVKTGQVSGLPADVPPSAMPGGDALDAFGGMFFKAQPGGARAADPVSVRAQLGAGQPLPGAVKGRMEAALGSGFGGVRFHTDAGAAALSDRLNAKAFTIGRDVAFAAGEYRPGTPAGDALIAHELAHVVQQDAATADPSRGPDTAESPGLEEDADRSAMGVIANLYGSALSGAGRLARNTRRSARSGLRLQRCKSAAQKAHEAEVDRLGGLQYDFLEKQRKDAEDQKRKEAEEAAKKSGLPPPVTPPTVSVDDIIKRETKASDPPKPTKPWTDLKPEAQADYKKRADLAWNKVVASVAGTELEKVVKGKHMKFMPVEALEQGYFGAQLGDDLRVGMLWVDLAEKDPKNVWPNVAHELGGHFEYGQAYATEIMMSALERLPEAERKKWKTDPTLRQKFFMVYEYAETEIFAELRERRYSKPETGTAPPNPTDSPDDDVPYQLGELKKNLGPEVAKAVVAHLKQRVDASPNLLERDKKFFAEQVKKIFGDLP